MINLSLPKKEAMECKRLSYEEVTIRWILLFDIILFRQDFLHSEYVLHTYKISFR
jgi:hypothetical protein